MVNRKNYLWVQAYLMHLAEHRQLDTKSVSRYWFYLRHLLLWAMDGLLSEANRISPAFATYLVSQRHRTEPLSGPTLKKIIATSQRLFRWLLVNNPREFRNLPAGWVDTLSPPKRPSGLPEHAFVTLDYVQQITSLDIDPADLASRRDQAAAAMLFLSGMRNSAFASLPIACVDIPGRTVRQDPSVGVRTKNGKSQVTFLLDIPDLLTVTRSWHDIIAARLPPSAMWYTPVTSRWGDQELSASAPGRNRNGALAKRLCKLAARAGLAPLSPHKYRHGHAVYALQRARDMADYKAISQNLMHADISITDSIYAPLIGSEIQKRIASLHKPSCNITHGPLPSSINQIFPDVADDELGRALDIIAQHLAR